MNTPEQAIAFMKNRAASGAQYRNSDGSVKVGNCLGSVRDAYGSPAAGGDATHAFLATTLRGADAYGALAWWTGGSAGHGHVAISLGDGTIYSTDFGPDRYYGDGRVRLIALGNVSKQSNPAAPLRFQTWSEDLDGQEIPMALTEDDIAKVAAAVKAQMGPYIISVASNQAAAITRALLDGSTGSSAYLNPSVDPLKSLVASYSLKAVKGGGTAQSTGSVDYAAIAKAVADEIQRRLTA